MATTRKILIHRHVPKTAGTTLNWSLAPALFDYKNMLLTGSEMPYASGAALKPTALWQKVFISGHDLPDRGLVGQMLSRRQSTTLRVFRRPETLLRSISGHVAATENIFTKPDTFARMLWEMVLAEMRKAAHFPEDLVLFGNSQEEFARYVFQAFDTLNLPMPVGPTRNASGVRRQYRNAPLISAFTQTTEIDEANKLYAELQRVNPIPEIANKALTSYLKCSSEIIEPQSGFLFSPARVTQCIDELELELGSRSSQVTLERDGGEAGQVRIYVSVLGANSSVIRLSTSTRIERGSSWVEPKPLRDDLRIQPIPNQFVIHEAEQRGVSWSPDTDIVLITLPSTAQLQSKVIVRISICSDQWTLGAPKSSGFRMSCSDN